jgi:Predicted transcriptional regulators
MEKTYYSISEVSEMLDISLSNLRFWEKEFKQLSPKRNNKGTRFYTADDIQLIKQIQHLVNDRKLTLEGAKRMLSDKKDKVAKQQEIAERLQVVRKELIGISKQLDN